MSIAENGTEEMPPGVKYLDDLLQRVANGSHDGLEVLTMVANDYEKHALHLFNTERLLRNFGEIHPEFATEELQGCCASLEQDGNGAYAVAWRIRQIAECAARPPGDVH